MLAGVLMMTADRLAEDKMHDAVPVLAAINLSSFSKTCCDLESPGIDPHLEYLLAPIGATFNASRGRGAHLLDFEGLHSDTQDYVD